MLDNLTIIIQTKNVDARPIMGARPLLKTMQHDEFPLSNDVLEMYTFTRIFTAFPTPGNEAIGPRLFAKRQTGQNILN